MTDLAQGMLDMLGGGTATPPPPSSETEEPKGPPKPNAVTVEVETEQEAATPPPSPAPPKPPSVPRPRADVAKVEAEARKEEAKTKREEIRASAKTTKLSKLVGSGEIVKLYKREGGERAKVGNFTERDLDGFDDLEDFVWEHIRPTWGYGTYETVYVDARGTKKEGPEIRFAAPTTGPAGVIASPAITGGGIGLRDLRQAEKDGEDRIRKLMDEVKRNGGSDALAASVMEMARQQQQQLINMMQEQVTAAQRRAADRPPPPPPPPADTTGAEAIKALSSIVEKITTQPAPKDDSHDRLLAFMKEERERDRDRREAEETRRREEERERIRREDEREKARMELERLRIDHETKQREKDREHQLELAKLSKNGDALSPFEQVAKAMEYSDKIRGNNGMTGMDAFGMFIENADKIAESIGGMIAAGKAAAKDGGGGGASKEQAKAKKAGFPEAMTPLVDDMKRGARDKDQKVMVEAVIKSMGVLGNDSKWKRAAQSVLFHIGNNNPKNALKELELFLQQLMDADEPIKMEEDTARAVMGALEENWEAIMEAASAFVQAQKK